MNSYESRLEALEAALRPAPPCAPPLVLFARDPPTPEDAENERKARDDYAAANGAMEPSLTLCVVAVEAPPGACA